MGIFNLQNQRTCLLLANLDCGAEKRLFSTFPARKLRLNLIYIDLVDPLKINSG